MSNKSPRPFAQNLKKARQHWGLTQQQVGNKLGGVDRHVISSYETDRSQPSMEVLAAICLLLQVRDILAFLVKETYDPNN